MLPLKVSDVLESTGGQLYCGNLEESIIGVCQDSRLGKENFAFFAIRGDAFDGHDFIKSAIEKGCTLVVVEDKKAIENIECKDVSIILVENTIKALQNLAKKYLDKLNLKKIAVTGSTGKTSTRDMTYYVCSEKYKTQKNQGNFNTVVGVPLTILEFDEDIEVAVIEMGMDRPGEIDTMVDIVRPDIGLITNIGVSHLENFENRDGIFKAKMEITNYFGKENTLIVTDGIDYLNHEKLGEVTKDKEYKLIFTGKNKEDSYRVFDIDQSSDEGVTFKVSHDDEIGEFFIPVLGRHNAFNACLAIAAGKQLGITFEEAARGLSKIQLTGKRLSIKEVNSIKVIDDTYNASPDSMKAALDILSKTSGKRHIAVLGDMFELGNDEIKYHREIGEIASQKADELYSIGDLSKNMNGDKHFDTVEEFIKSMKDHFKEGDVILVKASRGMALEQVVNSILENNK